MGRYSRYGLMIGLFVLLCIIFVIFFLLLHYGLDNTEPKTYAYYGITIGSGLAILTWIVVVIYNWMQHINAETTYQRSAYQKKMN